MKTVNKYRGLMAWALFLALAGSVTAAAVYLSWFRLPDPRSASGDAVVRWLVDRDLSREPLRVRRTLVDRLVRELPQWSENMDGAANLGSARRKRLEQNIAVLKHVWFTSRVDEFCRLDPADRDAFLDEQMTVMASWSDMAGVVQQPRATPSSASAPDEGISLIHDIDRWMGEACGDERNQMVEAVSAGLTRWLMTCDLGVESFGLRSELAERIAVALDGGLQPSGMLAGRSPDERSRLKANAELLMEAWYHRCAGQHAELSSADEKARYVARQIERIDSWSIEGLVQGEDDAAGDSLPAAARLVQMVTVWIDRAPAQRRAVLEDFFTALQQRYFLRLLNGG